MTMQPDLVRCPTCRNVGYCSRSPSFDFEALLERSSFRNPLLSSSWLHPKDHPDLKRHVQPVPTFDVQREQRSNEVFDIFKRMLSGTSSGVQSETPEKSATRQN